MKPLKHTEIIYILDRSGSMHSLQEAAISAFNNFVYEQCSVPGTAHLTLVQFDDRYEVPIKSRQVDAVPLLSTRTYIPRGTTALLDAIGRSIHDTEHRIFRLSEKKRPSKVILCIFTDGMENASIEFTHSSISKLIEKKRAKYGWEFLFLGANQDAIQTASSLSIHENCAANVSNNANGVHSVGSALYRKVAAIRYQHMGMLNEEQLEDFHKPLELIQEEEEQKP